MTAKKKESAPKPRIRKLAMLYMRSEFKVLTSNGLQSVLDASHDITVDLDARTVSIGPVKGKGKRRRHYPFECVQYYEMAGAPAKED